MVYINWDLILEWGSATCKFEGDEEKDYYNSELLSLY